MDFKRVNDTYGHRIGDQFLRSFSQKLGITLPIICSWYVDSMCEAYCARIGGDEFAILLSDASSTGIGADKDMANIVLSETSGIVSVDSLETFITPSIGAACYPESR